MGLGDVGMIVGLAIGFLSFVFVALIFRGLRVQRRNRQRVLDTGVDATATVIRIRDTGVEINGDPEVGILLEVQPADESPYQAEVKQTVSIVHLPAYQPGAQLQVKYDPANPSQVAIVSVIRGGALAGGSVPNSPLAAQ